MVDLFVNVTLDKQPVDMQLDWSITTTGGEMFKSIHSCSLIQSSFHEDIAVAAKDQQTFYKRKVNVFRQKRLLLPA